jgi:hypothetical protein
LGIRAEHKRNVGAVNIGIEQTRLEPELRQRQGKVHGERGFSHASFAGTDGYDRIHARQGLWPRLWLSMHV